MLEAAENRSRSMVWRTGRFFRDFVPQDTLQLLFPLATFLLIVCVHTPWFHIARGLSPSQLETMVRNNQLWFGPSRPWMEIALLTAQILISFSILASIALWILPVRNPRQKFHRWVFPPVLISLGTLLFAATVAISPRFSVAESSSQVFGDMLRRLPSRLATISYAPYLSVVAVLVFAIALRLARNARTSLPVQFRLPSRSSGPHPEAPDKRRVVTFLIVSAIIAMVLEIVSLPPFTVWRPARSEVLSLWLPGVIDWVLVSACGFWILANLRFSSLYSVVRRTRIQGCALGMLVGLAIVSIPRIIVKFVCELTPATASHPIRYLPSWSKLFSSESQPVYPWLAFLTIILVALFSEVALRGFLQTKLAQMAGLKRAIFLTALVSYVLPAFGGVDSSPGPRIPFHALALAVSLAFTIGESVVYGWLFVRTGSVIPGALVQTVVVYFQAVEWHGLIYRNHPSIYWLELATWIGGAWFLFAKLPPGRAVTLPLR